MSLYIVNGANKIDNFENTRQSKLLLCKLLHIKAPLATVQYLLHIKAHVPQLVHTKSHVPQSLHIKSHVPQSIRIKAHVPQSIRIKAHVPQSIRIKAHVPLKHLIYTIISQHMCST